MNDDSPTSSMPPSGAPPRRTSGGGMKWTPPSPEHMARLLSQYDEWKELGRGGMGAVYKARQISLDRPVAVKVLPPEGAPDEAQFITRFKNEAKLMARLNHPGVVSVFDFGETSEGQLYFVMEYVDGSDVAELIRKNQKLSPDQALEIMGHVCDALAYAHKHGVIHRDIKPANILINGEGRVKVADFGLAKMDDPSLTSALTRTHVTMGTPDFVAPEALIAGTVLDHRADLYAVGVMLYQMLTGELPRGMFKMPSVRGGGEIDPRIDAIIAKAMQPERDARYQSSTQIRKDLDAIRATPRHASRVTDLEASGREAPAPDGESERQSSPARTAPRKFGMLTLASVSAALLIAAGTAYLFNKLQAEGSGTTDVAPAGEKWTDALTSKLTQLPRGETMERTATGIRVSKWSGLRLGSANVWNSACRVAVRGEIAPQRVMIHLRRPKDEGEEAYHGYLVDFNTKENRVLGFIILQSHQPQVTLKAFEMPAGFSLADRHVIEFRAEGDLLSVFVDEQLVASARDSTHRSGDTVVLGNPGTVFEKVEYRELTQQSAR
jgi:serine/threonine protein kinase